MKTHLTLSLAALLAIANLDAATNASVDPMALTLLRRMSDSLSAAKAFTCRSRIVMELPATNGQSLTLVPEGSVALKRPDKLRARFAGDAPPLDVWYDGCSVTALAPHAGVFSSVKAPPTLDAMLTGLRRETGLRLPAIPLLKNNPYEALTAGLQCGVVVGESRVNGVPCQHLAFRRPGVNWEIWIETGDRALPRRLAATYTDRPGHPRTLIEFSAWNLHPWLPDSAFRFRKTPGLKEIPFPATLKDAGR